MKKPLSSQLRVNAMADGCNDLEGHEAAYSVLYVPHLGVLSYSSKNRTVGNNGVVTAARNVLET